MKIVMVSNALGVVPEDPGDPFDITSSHRRFMVAVLSIRATPQLQMERRLWSRVFKFIPNVDYLSIGEQSMTSEVLLALLCEGNGAVDEDHVRRTHLLPKLRTLLLQDYPFRYRTSAMASFAETLRDVFEMRKGAGIGLEQLVLRRCENIDERGVSTLREAITMQWEDERR
ncbi:hypothetical protein EUX98_g8129 [Antrodiella citrinella]|uniref:Uncharacterized protein n=1 Tax=Antrodiella citrinella TaxID=2447956 RepID=A0A4S4MDV4_9APHY|nr:hypothetical protein EUX98_g8129 [Antrodiella citrinella]